MAVVTRWQRKIVAFFHDPPDKPFGIAKHEERSKALIKVLLGSVPRVWDAIKSADREMSAADRLQFPWGSSRYWGQYDPVVVHPFSGRAYWLPPIKPLSQQDIERIVKKFGQERRDDRHLYLTLWRCLPDALSNTVVSNGNLRNVFDLIPAETRQPDHPLFLHLSLTAAAVDALQGSPKIPTFLHFSLSPVQSFIAAARKTQDLWAGSWLLSYLSWTALQAIVEEYGPDVIIYPWLYRQPLCDHWLRQQGVPCISEALRLELPTLPNKFVALLPMGVREGMQYRGVRNSAAAAEQRLLRSWDAIARKVREELGSYFDDLTKEIWDQQIRTFFSVFWSVFPWRLSAEEEQDEQKVLQPDEVLALYEELCTPQDNWEFRQFYEWLKESGPYQPNLGTVYSVAYELADRFFRSRKNTRNFGPQENQGSKCTMCGERQALRSHQYTEREFWNRIAKKKPKQVKGGGKERLCAVCTVKRWLPEILKQETKNILPQLSVTSYPSTSDIAAASFKQDMLELLLSSSEAASKLVPALEALFNALQDLGIRSTNDVRTVPYLGKLVDKLPDRLRKVGEQIVHYDGECFYPERYTTEWVEEEGGDLSPQKLQRARQKLDVVLRQARELGIAPPVKYYAILLMDGDRMGRWISGAYREKMPKFADILYPGLAEELERLDPAWQQILRQTRIVTPSFHALISLALNNFSLYLVPEIVEQRFPGRLVYAGGDDVLALLPLRDALPAARLLRAAFSGEIRTEGEKWEVAFGDSEITGYVKVDGQLLLTMGPSATASTGITISHHLDPLSSALQAARSAESTAKHRYGRNALGLYLLKRSGEEVQVGCQWVVSHNGSSQDVVAVLGQIEEALRSGRLSRSFPKALMQEAQVFDALPLEARKKRVRYLALHTGERESPPESVLQNLDAAVEIFASEQEEQRSWQQFTMLAAWLGVLRFFTTEAS